MTGILTLFVGMVLLLSLGSCNKTERKSGQQQVQNFSLIDVDPIYSSDEVQYDLKVFFTQPLEEEDALKVFTKDFVDKYGVTATYLGDRKYNYHLANIKREDQDRTIQLELDGKPLSSKSKVSRPLVVTAKNEFKPVDLKVDQEQCSATVYFSQPLQQRNIDGYISVDPVMGYRTEMVGNKLVLYFDKSNVSSYDLDDVTLVIGSGIKDANGNSLRSEQKFTLDLTELLPKVRWIEDGVLVPEGKDATVYFDAICLNSVILRIVKVYDDNILSFYQSNDFDDVYNIRKYGRLVKKVKLTLDNPTPNEWKTFPIVLSDYVPVELGAMYQLILDFGPADYAFATEASKQYTLEDDELEAAYWDGRSYSYKRSDYEGDWNDPLYPYYYNWVETEKNVIVSNLALTVKMGSDEVVDAYVFQITDAQPASGAEVIAYNYQRQAIASGKTDGKGHVQLDCKNRPAYVLAKSRSGGQSLLKTNNGNGLSYSLFDVGGESIEKGVAAFAYSNRGVWRPGDELQLNLMLSDLDSKLPKDYPVVMEIRDASNRMYARQSNNSPVGGIYTFKVPTSPNDETGLWKAVFKVGNNVVEKYLRVETVKPNRLEIKFNTPEVVSLSKSQSANLNAKWLNGLIASGLKAEIDVKVSKGTTSFKNFPTYTFGNDAEVFYPEEYELFSGPLDGQGNASVSFDPLSDLNAEQMLKATFIMKVFEPGGDFSLGSTKALLSPYERYVGVEMPKPESKYGNYYYTNRDWTFPIAVVRENGELAKSAISLSYQFYKLDNYWWWSSEDAYSLKKYVNRTYKRPEMSGTLNTNNGKSSITLNVPDDKWGLYLLVITDDYEESTFAKVMRFDWSYGTIHSSGSSGGPVELTLSSAKDTYKVGEEIIVNFPSNENSKAVVTVETNDRVIQSYLLDKLGKDGQVKIKATEQMIPNVYVYVSLLQPRDDNKGLPLRMYGVVPVKVEDDKLQLKPVLNVPESSNTKKTIQVTVKEENSKNMTYTLAVVDEGILGLTNYSIPDPYGYFNAKQALKVRTWDNYDLVIDGYTGEFGTLYAVGGDDDGGDIPDQETTLNKRFKAYAVTLGPFELKGGKTNTHEFEVPQCSGALRFMVVAKGDGKSFGAAEKQMKVVDPINLFASVPRVTAPGDEMNLKVQVLAPTMKGKDLKVTLKNKNLNTVGDAPATVKIGNDGEGMVEMKVKVPETLGNATFDVTVSGGGYDAQTTTLIPIRMPNAIKRNTYTEEIEPKASKTVKFDLKGLKDTQEGNVMVASLIPVDFYSRLNYLSTYPYGCLEQVVSAAFPQLYFNYFIQQSEEDQQKTRDAVMNGINSLKSYQKADFSLTNWVGGNYTDPWTEIYALHFLVEAKNQGFDVPAYLYDGMVKHQADIAKAWRNNPDFPQGETIQAYRLFTLALCNAPEMGALNRFKENKFKYSLSSLLTAATYAQVGKKNMVSQFWPAMESGEKMSDYISSFGSTTRDLAFLTYSEILCGKDKESIKAHVNDLCEILNSSRWLDTQSTAFALFTLGKYAEKVGATSSPISTTVSFNGKETTLSSNVGSAAYAVIPSIGSNTVVIKNNGDQKVTAKVYTKTAVAEYETAENGNFIKMKVNYFDKKGAALNPESLPMGTDFVAEITVENPSDYRVTELALSYYVASGWEIVNERVAGDESDTEAKHLDIRDDRAYYFFDLSAKQKKTFRLKLNATYEGSFMLPAVRCEDMYNNDIYYVVPARKVVVR